MFEIDLAKLKKGKTHKSFTLKPESIDLSYKEAEFEQNIKVNLTFHRSARKIEVTADINTEAVLECDLCLEEYTHQVDLEESITIKLLDYSYNQQKPESPEINLIYSYPDEEVELGKLIHDAIIVSLPIKHKCKEDCKGLCFVCGTNLNYSECGCDRDVRIKESDNSKTKVKDKAVIKKSEGDE